MIDNRSRRRNRGVGHYDTIFVPVRYGEDDQWIWFQPLCLLDLTVKQPVSFTVLIKLG